MGVICEFLDQYFLHFNSCEVVDVVKVYEVYLDVGGKMLVSFVGAMSTVWIGWILLCMICFGKVHVISCIGVNFEEDLFMLFVCDEYELIQDWWVLSVVDELVLYDCGMNWVIDICIFEMVMKYFEKWLLVMWKHAFEMGVRRMLFEYLFEVLRDELLCEYFQVLVIDSWMLAVVEMGVLVYFFGWEDLIIGNMFAVVVMKEELFYYLCVKIGIEQMEYLICWYLKNNGLAEGMSSVGFFQVGGGIVGDFVICVVLVIIQDFRKEDMLFWGYFVQISDVVTSYGGYFGAVPNEKIMWGKFEASMPKFMIQLDAIIVAPLIFAYVLGD